MNLQGNENGRAKENQRRGKKKEKNRRERGEKKGEAGDVEIKRGECKERDGHKLTNSKRINQAKQGAVMKE